MTCPTLNAEEKARTFLAQSTTDRGPVFQRALRKLTRYTEELETLKSANAKANR